MSKRNKAIAIEIKEIKNKENQTYEVISDGKNTIGTITQVGNKFQIITAKDQYKKMLNTLDAAINEVLTYFNLHEK